MPLVCCAVLNYCFRCKVSYYDNAGDLLLNKSCEVQLSIFLSITGDWQHVAAAAPGFDSELR